MLKGQFIFLMGWPLYCEAFLEFRLIPLKFERLQVLKSDRILFNGEHIAKLSVGMSRRYWISGVAFMIDHGIVQRKRTICRLCQIEYKIAREYEKTHPEVSYCTSCRAYKSKDKFYLDPRYKKKPRAHCKECVVKENVNDKILRRLEKELNISSDMIMSIACGGKG